MVNRPGFEPGVGIVDDREMASTTGTTIRQYLEWVREELSKKEYGEVAIKFTIHRGQVVDVRKESVDLEHKPLKKQG
jgi:acetolactate synthase small subunit